MRTRQPLAQHQRVKQQRVKQPRMATAWGKFVAFGNRIFGNTGYGSSLGTSYGYEGAGWGRRMDEFRPSWQHTNSLLSYSGQTLLARARHLVLNNPYAAKAKATFVGNAIGTGIYPASKIKDMELREAVLQLWLRFTDEVDADDLTDFYGLQTMAAGAIFEAGECFVRRRWRRKSDGLLIPFQLQLMESEQLPLSYNEQLKGSRRIRCGIETNSIGKRTAYHFLREHPGNIYTGLVNYQDTVRIPARDILHLFEPMRPGQLRGQTRLAACIVRLYMSDAYDDAEMDRKKTAAMFAGFIKRPLSDMVGTLGEDVNEKTSSSNPNVAEAELAPGTMNVLLDGEEVTFSSPTEVGGTYEVFQRRTLLAVAAAMGIPYEKMTGDLLGVSYSSLREGVIEFRRCLEQWQHMVMVYQLCRPVWAWFMDAAVMSGALMIPDYLEHRADYLDVEWIPDAWLWVDPLKDRKAQEHAIGLGIKSLTQACREEGNDYGSLMHEMAKERELQKALGLSFKYGTVPDMAAGRGMDDDPADDPAMRDSMERPRK